MTTATPAPETSTSSKAFDQLLTKLRRVKTLESVGHLTSWDQETKMPPKGGPARAEQLALMSGLAHEAATNPDIGELIESAEADSPDDASAAALREIKRDYQQNTKLPQDLVEEMARCSSLGMDAWKPARKDNHFPTFLPWLEKTVELNNRKAECLGIPEGASEPYDALLDLFEPQMTAKRTEEIFAPLRDFTVDLLARIREKTEGFTRMPDTKPAEVDTDTDKQKAFTRRFLETMGFDFDAGRLDEAAHPFCSGFGPGDTRLTNRYRPDGWLDALSGGMHEGGHGLYEQGLPKSTHFGSPLAEAVSLGIHESQSRMWENQLGRSREFWNWALPIAKQTLGSALENCDTDTVFRADNLIQPSYIRVESDELTYNLHIMLRFDMERAMLKGDLNPKDLPAAWNERFERDWGLKVDKDANGCLQDVHWSMGAIGYFPTYTFGNLYAAQLWEAIARDIPDRDARIEKGDFKPVLDWTRTHIHAHGRRFPAEELAKRATGQSLSHEALARHLEAKAAAVYDL